MLLKKVLRSVERPALFEKGTSQMWTDEYISEQMLAAHLDTQSDGASRKPETITTSVNWIDKQICGENRSLELLDLGCGPGMYTTRLSKLGYKVTGIDFSLRSIEYAKQEAFEADLNVSYYNEDYLAFDFPGTFDVIMMIYCDFGVLDDEGREKILNKAYDSLKSGGVLLFDVFQPNKYKGHVDSNDWYAVKSGFWRQGSHLCLNSSHWYVESGVHLDQAIVIDELNHTETYNIWDKTFSSDEIGTVLQKHGFDKIEFYSDVTGKPYNDDSETICIVARKN